MVFTKKVNNPYNFRKVSKSRNRSCFFHKFLAPLLKKHLRILGTGPDSAVIRPSVSYSKALWIIFLNCNSGFQIKIQSYICNTKAAFTYRISDQIFSFKNAEWWNMMPGELECSFIKSTKLTYSTRILFFTHTINA